MTPTYLKAAAAIPKLKVAACDYNSTEITNSIKQADQAQAQVVVFPELAITGYSCGDLFSQKLLLDQALQSLLLIVKETQSLPILSVVGMPLVVDSMLFNVAVVFQRGQILGVVPKTHLPNYAEFQEHRWFVSGAATKLKEIQMGDQCVPFGTDLLFAANAICLGIEICEDLWAPIPPSSVQALNGANVILNLSASNELVGKHHARQQLIEQHAARSLVGYVYTSAGFGESSTDLIYTGNALITELDQTLATANRFAINAQLVMSEIDIDLLAHERRTRTNRASLQTEQLFRTINFQLSPPITQLTRPISTTPFIPATDYPANWCSEAIHIQALGLAKRFDHIQAQTAVIGISGGLDSTLALLVTIRAFELLNIPTSRLIGITMPGFGTSNRTLDNANRLMAALQITTQTISIEASCIQHFKDINHDVNKHDVVFENTQARERTQLLMDVANQHNGVVIGTGDLSELALGWATYNGDHMSMYNVNAGVPKTMVRKLVEWEADQTANQTVKDLLIDVINTPISPELLPNASKGASNQVTEDLVGPYILHDFYLYHFLKHGATPAKLLLLATHAFEGKYDKKELQHWMLILFRRFFQHQFKRSCSPDGPKVFPISLSPRGDWRMPSDACCELWIKACEKEMTEEN